MTTTTLRHRLREPLEALRDILGPSVEAGELEAEAAVKHLERRLRPLARKRLGSTIEFWCGSCYHWQPLDHVHGTRP